MLTTTLKAIKAKGPCEDGWRKLLAGLNKKHSDNKILLLETILEINGIEDAVWALRAIDEKYDNSVRLFNCFCAKYVLDIFEKKYPEDKRARKAIETAEKFAWGEASEEELVAAWSAAWSAARDAAWTVARDAAWDHFKQEFIRLCRLEGEYGEVISAKSEREGESK